MKWGLLRERGILDEMKGVVESEKCCLAYERFALFLMLRREAIESVL